MGADLAATHLGVADRSKPILRDIERRDRRNPAWLKEAAAKAVGAVEDDHARWAKYWNKKSKPKKRTPARNSKRGARVPSS